MSEPLQKLRRLVENAYPHARFLDREQVLALLDLVSKADALIKRPSPIMSAQACQLEDYDAARAALDRMVE